MSKLRSVAAAVVVGLFLVGLVAVPVMAVQPSAPAPAWKVGDTWAMGAEVNYGSELTDNITTVKQMVQTYLNMTIDKLDVNAVAGYYLLFKVTGDTGSSYTVNAKLAAKIEADASVKVTGIMPKAGTYDSDQNPMSPASTVAKESKTMSLDVSEKFGFVIDTYATLNKTTLAVQNMTWGLRTAMVFDLVGKNIPQTNETAGNTTISYQDYDLGMDLAARMNLSIAFNPALDIYQFPIVPNEYWTINKTEATISGDVSGFLDMHGLPAETQSTIFTPELKNATGATDFPIEFDHLTSPDGEITDGHFGPYTYNTTAKLAHCLPLVLNQTVNGVSRDIYVINIDGEKDKLYYSPGFKFMTSMNAAADPAQFTDVSSGTPVSGITDGLTTSLPIDPSMATSLLGGQNVQMEAIDVANATSNIASISDYTENVASQAGANAPGASNNGLGDFFLKAPYLGVIMVVASALVIAALLFYGLRPRKPQA